MSASALAARIHAFERELETRCATRIEPTAFGTAFLNLDFPLRYDSNFVWVERPLEGVDADALAADADRVLGEHPFEHREVRVDDDEHGGRLVPGFRELGWTAERLVVMRAGREPEPRPAASVREVGFEDARGIVEECLRREPLVKDEATVRMLAGFRGVLERAVGARFFVADAGDRPASVCELYRIGAVAQVEDVNTLAELRGRGLASAVVLAATATARERGCDLVFLVAEEDDWPKELYARLGFDAVSRFWRFRRWP